MILHQNQGKIFTLRGTVTLAESLNMLTHLHDVVLADRADDPGVVGVPAEVGDLGRVAAVDEQQLRRAVLGVLGALKRW